MKIINLWKDPQIRSLDPIDYKWVKLLRVTGDGTVVDADTGDGPVSLMI